MGPPLINYGNVIVVAVLVCTHSAAYFYGREAAQESYNEYKREVAIAMEKVQAENDQKRRASERILADTVDGWAAAVGVLRARDSVATPVVRVRRPTDCGQPTMPAVPETTSGTLGLQTGEPGSGSARTIAVEECEARLNGSILDAIWIERVKALTNQLHETTR